MWRHLCRRRGDRGAVAALTALIAGVLVVSGALVVDIGMQRVARADMQALADVVALDLARELDDTTTAGELQDDVELAAQASMLRNSSVIGFDPADPPDLDVELGRLVSGEFQPVPASEVPTAVRVRAGTSVGFAFSGITGVPDGGAARSAVSVANSAACFQLGSYAATVKPAAAALFGDLMEQLIGQSTVGLVGYNGLATTWVELDDVLGELSVSIGTVEQLASTSVAVSDFYLAIAKVLERKGKTAEAKVLEWAAASLVGPVRILLGDLIGVSTSSDAALETEFNVLDLLVGSAFLANGENFLDLANFQAGNSAIGWTNTRFQIIEEPRRACDDDEAQTAQVRLNSTANLQLDNAPLLKSGPVDVRLIGADDKPDNRVVLNLAVEIAGAHGVLTSVECDPVTFEADIWRDLITASLTGSVRVGGTVQVSLNLRGLLPELGLSLLEFLQLGLADVVTVQVPIEVAIDIAATASKPPSTLPTHVSVSYPPQKYGEPYSTGIEQTVLPDIGIAYTSGSLQTGPVTVGRSLTIPTEVLDAAVNPVLQAALPALLPKFDLANQVIDTVNAILVPLQTGMGITISGADFFALPTPQCGTPQLRG